MTTSLSVMDEWMTPDELAAEMKITKRGVYQLNEKRTGPPYFKVGREIRYLRSEVTAWQQTLRVPR